MSEFDIIRKYFSPLAKSPRAFGLRDDAAVVDVPQGMELVVTTDAIAEGVHFIGNETPSLIAEKLLRVNLSDLAAMGAKPCAYFLALMLPEKTDESWIMSFAEGLRSAQEAFGITLMGGDTTRSRNDLCLSVTALGLVVQGRVLRRSGARAGDDIYVSGTIGDAALGLQVAKEELRVAGCESYEFLLKRYRLPTPRLELGQELASIANSCMDISDGLMQDMGHIAECSGVEAVIEWEKIPLSDAAREALPLMKTPHEAIAGGGDDYELVFTVPAASHDRVQDIARKTGVNITRIGSIKEGQGAKLVDKEGKTIYLSRAGYDHFR